MEIQKNQIMDLNDAVRYIAMRLGFGGTIVVDEIFLKADSIYLNSRIKSEEQKNNKYLVLKQYDKSILNNLNYNLRIKPWLDEGITQEVIEHAQIGYYLGGDQISIPHFDIDGNFIGLRGRSLCQEDCDKYGKYRPLIINK